MYRFSSLGTMNVQLGSRKRLIAVDSNLTPTQTNYGEHPRQQFSKYRLICRYFRLQEHQRHYVAAFAWQRSRVPVSLGPPLKPSLLQLFKGRRSGDRIPRLHSLTVHIYLHRGSSSKWILLTCNQCLLAVSFCLRQARVSPTLRITSTPASIRLCTSATRSTRGVL